MKMKYKRWGNLSLIQKIAFYLVFSVIGAVFVLPFIITLLFLLKLIGVI